ncbi:hypothetical protein BpOF4_21619 (plasmid) [Alkalihalophilus pseudofirmus OF4]|uniref:Uncharacterized protein n=2 Tax=Alkalihalophilus TaxID=2893060 RepID=D3G1U3_ALKPO|nr:hypothetical protein BpOF4_21619 [Alkalihalophilus pseudofirmus OF4]ERN51520.1 hypothetical protein A33I_20330 [Alkalihalophilus marmarensis DSM 21297]
MIPKGLLIISIGAIVALIRFFAFGYYQFTGIQMFSEAVMYKTFVIKVILFTFGFVIFYIERRNKKGSVSNVASS